jgi:FMN-dependent oxidoreductase (nitrilotriacetate monooxygenase family)
MPVNPIVLGAFEMNGLNLTSQGLWAHPEQQTHRYTELAYWTELARLLDQGCFDFLFFADSYGYPEIRGETPEVTFEQAVEIPKDDPMLLVPALSAATTGLSFIVTTSTTFEHPYANARRFTTLDHLTGGRVAWNVVTTSNAVVPQLFGSPPVPHDESYARAADFVELSYKLWEGSWEDGAVVADKPSRRYADPSRVHRIDHDGPYFSSHGYFCSEPSLQRTPVICQAGASATGRAFAAANAEVVFLQGRDATMLREQVDDVRKAAVDAGRAPTDITAISGLSIVTGSSRAQAEERLEEYLSWIDPAGVRVYFAHMTGIDLAALDPDASFASVTTDGGRTQVERYRNDSVAAARTDFMRRGMRELIAVGTPSEVADQIEAIVADSGLNGFNYRPFVSPGSYRDMVELVVPELQRMGLVRTERAAGTFRERLSERRRRGVPARGANPSGGAVESGSSGHARPSGGLILCVGSVRERRRRGGLERHVS